MAEALKKEDVLILNTSWNLPFRHTAGAFGTRFFKEIQNKKIFGVRCPQCRRVLMPPRPFCEHCYVTCDEWVEVGAQGTLEGFTICYVPFLGLPTPPVAMILVKLDGTDSCLQHILREVDLSDPAKARESVKIGMRVEAVWKEERTGSIGDISHFRPV
ncbi:MAG: Zn-ribbon domain-containing OB-fold protein [Actinomycetota bacterium]